jgi:tetraacyldisaccharide 4'-kinase
MASRAWAARARVERPLAWRDGATVVVVGGPTLGGSGKTPLAIACAEELRRRGASVALVGHAYGASPRRARIVSPDDDVRVVGDEALACARRLGSLGVPVVVGPTRQAALDLALEASDVVVVDGLCQATPRRATLALLAVDACAPWGAGHCPPRGDMRARCEAVLSAVDRVVVIGGELRLPELGLPAHAHAEVVSEGAWSRGTLLGWDALRRLRLGLWTGVARPERILRGLAKHGVHPEVMRFGADHHPRVPWGPPDGRKLDLWLTTAKCHAHLKQAGEGGVPVAVLDHALRLDDGLQELLSRLDPREPHP